MKLLDAGWELPAEVELAERGTPGAITFPIPRSPIRMLPFALVTVGRASDTASQTA